MPTTMGRISISNALCYSHGNNGFQFSALLQELLVYAGQLECHERCHEVLDKFLSVQVSATQVWQLTDLYGAQLAKTHDFTEGSQLVIKEQEPVRRRTNSIPTPVCNNGKVRLRLSFECPL